MFRAVVAVVALCLVSACNQQGSGDQGSPRTPSPTPNAPLTTEAPAAQSSPASDMASAAAPPPAFGQCALCHSVKPGETRIGPSLAGVFGTRAASVPGFAFSPALKASGLTLDEPTLDRFLTAPMKVVPGTRMAFAGVADPAKRQAIIAYLKTI